MFCVTSISDFFVEDTKENRQAMFSCNSRFHRHRRKLICHVLKAVLVFLVVSMIATHTILIKEITNVEFYNQSRNTKETELSETLKLVNRRSSQLKLQENSLNTLVIKVTSSKENVTVTVDNTVIYEDKEALRGRGIHVLVLNQATGSVMAQRIFDTYSPHEDDAMSLFLSLVSDKRIIVFAIKDEGTFQMKPPTRELISRFGSTYAKIVGWRDMWAMVAIKGVRVISEGYKKSPDFSSWSNPVHITAEIPLSSISETQCLLWPEGEETRRRQNFCNEIEGYGSVCSCSDPSPIMFNPPPVLNNQISDVPVTIIASNRPHYLYRMLRTLLTANGANPDIITVFIDGFYDEPLAVAKLFGLRGVQHAPMGVRNSRISQHYKSSLSSTFQIFPHAKYAIVLEEDLDVSPDFFGYFSQTVRLLDEDPSLYCISAWNDQGYEHTSADPSKIYRVETMPGLGWILKKSLYKEELEARWPTPDKTWDWDMWMRLAEVRRGRECVIPDVSRTYHFGSSGLNMNSYFHDIYFNKHSFNTVRDVEILNVDSIKKDAYEKLLESEISQANVLNHDQSPCDETYFPEKGDRPNVLYIEMNHSKDFVTWLTLAKCLHVWDLDARGYHRGMWRIHYNDIPLFIIGAPFSPYSIHMPVDVVPIFMSKEETKKEVHISN